MLSQKKAARKKKCIAVAEMIERIKERKTEKKNTLINLNIKLKIHIHTKSAFKKQDETCWEITNNKPLLVQWALVITHIHADSKAASNHHHHHYYADNMQVGCIRLHQVLLHEYRKNGKMQEQMIWMRKILIPAR